MVSAPTARYVKVKVKDKVKDDNDFGGFMKKYFYIILGLGVVFSLVGCDPACYTDITINNQSSYDLRLNFEHSYHHTQMFPKTVDVAKDATNSFNIDGFDFDDADPNKNVQKIIILNLSDSSILKETENNNLFVVTQKKKFVYRSDSSYLLDITDELLQ